MSSIGVNPIHWGGGASAIASMPLTRLSRFSSPHILHVPLPSRDGEFASSQLSEPSEGCGAETLAKAERGTTTENPETCQHEPGKVLSENGAHNFAVSTAQYAMLLSSMLRVSGLRLRRCGEGSGRAQLVRLGPNSRQVCAAAQGQRDQGRRGDSRGSGGGRGYGGQSR